jgi:hypothetical protein
VVTPVQVTVNYTTDQTNKAVPTTIANASVAPQATGTRNGDKSKDEAMMPSCN